MPRPASPPSHRPAAWADRDAALATQIALAPGDAAAEVGRPPCRCGGTWRYPLLPHGRHPLWRCLHCGTLHLGAHAVAEDEAPPAERPHGQGDGPTGARSLQLA